MENLAMAMARLCFAKEKGWDYWLGLHKFLYIRIGFMTITYTHRDRDRQTDRETERQRGRETEEEFGWDGMRR